MKEIHREIIKQEGGMTRYRIWRQGHHHYLGQNIDGWTGKENVYEQTVIRGRVLNSDIPS